MVFLAYWTFSTKGKTREEIKYRCNRIIYGVSPIVYFTPSGFHINEMVTSKHPKPVRDARQLQTQVAQETCDSITVLYVYPNGSSLTAEQRSFFQVTDYDGWTAYTDWTSDDHRFLGVDYSTPEDRRLFWAEVDRKMAELRKQDSIC